jgi:transcriptional regulator GlxA family with amidase domain
MPVTTGRTGEVIFAVSDGVLLLDLAGPVQVFGSAGGYRVRLASLDGHPVRTDVGISMSVDCALSDLDIAVDTLVVPGYPSDAFPLAPELVDGVKRLAPHARRVVSVCTGAFVLAEAGVLDGRRATTHWIACAELAARFPRVTVEPDAIYVRDGSVVTSAGASAGIDLALALVGEDHGEDRARAVAKYLVVFLQRPGGQSQFNARGTVTAPRNAILRRALDLIVADPSGDHRLTTMAAELAISERHLTRLCRRELGLTPGQVVERLRVEAAQALLESGDTTVAAVASTCGFGSQETMRRAFLRVLGVAPSTYRHRFRLSNQRSVPDRQARGV